MNLTRTRGVSTSSAVLSENEIDRASRPAVGFSSVPCAADRRTNECSSTAERAERSSSCGSTPISFRTRLAAPFNTTISGLNSIVEIRMGVMTVFAVSSGSAIAMFFGTSSPKTMDRMVAMDSPNSSPTDSAVIDDRPMASNGTATSDAIAGCMTKPSARVVTVIPTCAPDSWVDSDRSPIISDFAPLSPSAACLATVALSTVTRLNSADTYSAVPAIRIRPTPTRIHSVIKRSGLQKRSVGRYHSKTVADARRISLCSAHARDPARAPRDGVVTARPRNR